MENLQTLLAPLNEEQRQVLKDCINHGLWGNCEQEFINAKGEIVTSYCNGYCTNDAKLAGHFSGRKISALFRGIYSKLCGGGKNKNLGEVLCHCSDWWGDGKGDMLFIKDEYVNAFETWARE